jgi:hypothetical protein
MQNTRRDHGHFLTFNLVASILLRKTFLSEPKPPGFNLMLLAASNWIFRHFYLLLIVGFVATG